ncbi:MAG: IS200/IS605 family accessory protein TnpB-related protein, partial [Bacteroidota bacterium]|nr:IS200/IS605 family accessory protein TnpB-related protein [Bacteroidota bacterium]
TSDGIRHTGDWLHEYREKSGRIRSTVQSRGTKGSKRLLKRTCGKEKTTARTINHTISKSIVASARAQGKGISIEDLSHIRRTSKRRNKKFRARLGRWSFSEARTFLTYKSRLSGVPLVVVDPAEISTAQTCSVCHHIGRRRRKRFECGPSRKPDMDADVNASKNIAARRRCHKPS